MSSTGDPRRSTHGLRISVGLVVVIALLVVLGLGRLAAANSIRPVVTSGQAAAVALRSIPMAGPPFSSFTGYQVVLVKFEPRASHVYQVYPSADREPCGQSRPAWACPLAPAWLVTFAAPPQAGYRRIDGAMLVDAVHGSVFDWDVRASG
jgi:hypothetical protein